MRFVLDNSVVMRWLFGDGSSTDLAYASYVLDLLDPVTAIHTVGDTLQLARRLALSSYDTAYLELALRERLPIATLDDKLRAAAVDTGVAVA